MRILLFILSLGIPFFSLQAQFPPQSEVQSVVVLSRNSDLNQKDNTPTKNVSSSLQYMPVAENTMKGSSEPISIKASMDVLSNNCIRSAEGRYAITSVEGKQGVPNSKLIVTDFKYGSIIQEKELGGTINALAMHPVYKSVLVGTDAIHLMAWDQNLLGDQLSISQGEYNENPSSIIDIEWHPTKDLFAVSYGEKGSVCLYVLEKNGQGYSIVPFGGLLNVGKNITDLVFSQDGAYLFALDRMSTGQKGQVRSIQLNLVNGEHKVIDSSEIGMNPERLIHHPTMPYVVCTNSRGAHLPEDSYYKTSRVTLSLIRTSRGGKLDVISEIPFLGKRPMDLSFDKEGKVLSVLLMETNQTEKKEGAILFWSFEGNHLQGKLNKLSEIQPVSKGAYSLKLY